MSGERTGGFRLFNFRQGDRSEYLALYALTRIAFVTPVPRQEDFGVVDFRCVLAKKDGGRFIPSGTFNVQVKSEETTLQLASGEIRWLSTNMDCPLFMCVVDKAGTSIKLYSSQNVWSALFFRMHPQNIKLIPGTNSNDEPYVYRAGTTGDPEIDLDGEFDVYLGQPVIDMSLADFEDRADEVFAMLDVWIKLDRLNIALMRLGRAATFAFEAEKPNQLPTRAKGKVFARTVNQHGLLDKIYPLLESLAQSYEKCGAQERVAQIRALLAIFENDRAACPGTFIDRLLTN